MNSYPSGVVASAGRWLAAGTLLALPLVMAGCGEAEQQNDATDEIAAPPNPETVQPLVAEGAELPAWGYSGACDQPRPNADDDGLVRPDPIAGEQDVAIYVPGVEEVLCKINGVDSASVIGTYTDSASGSSGSVDVGLVMRSESSEENMRSVRQAAVTAAEQQGLSTQGIALGEFTLYLSDGSFVKAPSQGQVIDGSMTLSGAAIQALDQLRQSDAGQRWSVEVGEDLTLITYLEQDPSQETTAQDVESALQTSRSIPVPAMTATRVDQVLITHNNLTLIYTEDEQQNLSGALVEDLQDLSQADGVHTVTAKIVSEAGGPGVLRIEIEPSTPGSEPNADQALQDLEQVAGLRGLQVEEIVVGVPTQAAR